MSETGQAEGAKTPDGADGDAKKRQREKVEKLLVRAPVVANDSIILANGRQLEYGVSAAFIPVLAEGLGAERGDPDAAVFTVAYSAKKGTGRPVCFVFNGGPGSASVWLHLGALGPKRIPVNDDGTMPTSPWRVADNPLTWLSHFDLVFVDPPHTGFSITASEAARKKMLSVDGDVDALAETMRGWLAANGRFGAPLYIAGESYGTTRGAALADKMQDIGLALDGLILISCAMDLQSIVFAPRNDLPYALYLPGFANAAQFHGRLKGALSASSEAARAAAEAFVAEDYLAALHAGSRLDGRTRSRVEKRIAELTGLPVALVQEKNLRISDQTFFVEALRDAGRIIGRLEARVTGPMALARSRDWEFDPGMEAIVAPYTTAALCYYGELGIANQARYEVLSMEVNKQWSWLRGEGKGLRDANGFTCTSTDLARAMRRNTHLRVLVASGRYDLGTPYSASDWSLAQLDAPADVLTRITHRYYDAGHMFYTRPADLAQLKTDLVAWLK